jgi:hypothetical protein
MKTKTERTISRREFAQRAAVLSATAPFLPAEMIRPDISRDSAPQTAQNTPKLTAAGQAEADSRYQQVLTLYSDRLDDAQKANIKRMCAELQPSLERIRNFKLQNSDVPALYLKPLYERDRKPQSTNSKPAVRPGKPQ